MSTYFLSEDALLERLAKARRRLRLKYGLLTLLVVALGVLNYQHNDQRHWQTELVALTLCAILLVAGYSNGRRAILLGKRSPKEIYELTVGRDSVSCRDIKRGETVLHVSEITQVDADASVGLRLRAAHKERSIVVPIGLEGYHACVAELRRIGVRV